MRPWLLLPLLVLQLHAEDFSKLPAWAQAEAEAASLEQPPAGADAWVLLQRTEFAYCGGGEIRSRCQRLVKVLGERGLKEAQYAHFGLGGRASKILKLRGWNLRPDGELVKLDADQVFTVQDEHQKVTVTTLSRAAKGSYLAFETEESLRSPLGPIAPADVLDPHPVRRWELTVAKRDGLFTNLVDVAVRMDLRNLTTWLPKVAEVPGQSLAASNLPARPRPETAAPGGMVLPWVAVTFLDPALKGPPSMASWDTLATWTWEQFSTRLATSRVVDLTGASTLEGLKAIHRWMSREMTYKAVYLSPERGWVPEPGPEVARKRYGDCKDLASLFLSEAQVLGLEVFPVLATISEGRAGEEAPVGFIFNHAIAAVKLNQTLGLASEIATPQGRFLLVDATDRYTPLGMLSSAHLGRKVLLCTSKGGLWLTIPAGAILMPKSRWDFEGTVETSGALTATLRLTETGNALGLQAAALEGGASALAGYLRETCLDLPPNGKLDVTRQGDPLDLSHPFEVEVRLSHPNGFRLASGEGNLVAWGFPAVPPVLQKAGAPRRFPVEVQSCAVLEHQAIWHLPWPVTPVLPSQTTDTPFRRFTWKAEKAERGGKPALVLSLTQERKPATFGYEALVQGLAAWKQDRSAVATLVEDGLAFRVEPPL